MKFSKEKSDNITPREIQADTADNVFKPDGQNDFEYQNTNKPVVLKKKIIQKQTNKEIMKTSVLLIFLLFLFANCNKIELKPENEASNTYQLKINYSPEMGNVLVDPLLDSYPEGTVVKISANPNQGVTF